MKWINTKKKRPGLEREVLACCACQRWVGLGMVATGGNDPLWNIRTKDGWMISEEVTHWMPLPDLPMENENYMTQVFHIFDVDALKALICETVEEMDEKMMSGADLEALKAVIRETVNE